MIVMMSFSLLCQTIFSLHSRLIEGRDAHGPPEDGPGLLLGPLWAILGCAWALSGQSWAALGASVGGPGLLLGPQWAVLGGSRGLCGWPWAAPGASVGGPGLPLGLMRAVLGHPWAKSGPFSSGTRSKGVRPGSLGSPRSLVRTRTARGPIPISKK